MSANPFSRFFNRLAPFLGFGIAIAVFIGLIMLLSYFLIWGVFIGLVLYAGAFLHQKFFKSKTPQKTESAKGRLFEHDDHK